MQQHPQHLHGLRCRERWRRVANPLGSQEPEGDSETSSHHHQIVTPAHDWVPQKEHWTWWNSFSSPDVYVNQAQFKYAPSTSQGTCSCLTAQGWSAPGPKLWDRTRVTDCCFGPFILRLFLCVQNKCTYRVTLLRVIIKFNEIIYFTA